MKKGAFIFIFLCIYSAGLLAQPFKVGDKVEAYNVSWYKATVLQIGSGDKQGYYMIHYDDYSSASDQWVANKNVRSRKVVKEDNTMAPRVGKYHVLSYFTYNPIRLGHFILSPGNKYSFYDNGGNLVGAGNYSYSQEEKNILWKSGPFNTNKWEGKFAISREGKTHSITLKRGTVGSNSTDSK